jgi:hypothetical protein
MTTTRVALIASLAVLAATLGCAKKTVVYQERDTDVVVVDGRGGPPPHAPAHGYRLKHAHDNVELVYDADIDVYIVTGFDCCYYSAGQYFRFEAKTWEWCASVNGPWKVVTHDSDLPPGLRHKHGKGHGKKKGHDK